MNCAIRSISENSRGARMALLVRDEGAVEIFSLGVAPWRGRLEFSALVLEAASGEQSSELIKARGGEWTCCRG